MSTYRRLIEILGFVCLLTAPLLVSCYDDPSGPDDDTAGDDDATGDDDTGDDDTSDDDSVVDDDTSLPDDDSAADCQLVITEVLPIVGHDVNGDTILNVHDGFVEMANFGSEACALDGMAVKMNTSDYLRHVFDGGTTLEPSQFLILVDDEYGDLFTGVLPAGEDGFVVEANQGSDITSNTTFGDDLGLVTIYETETSAAAVTFFQWERLDDDYDAHGYTRYPENDPAGAEIEHPYHPCSSVMAFSAPDLHTLGLCADGSSFSGGCPCAIDRAVPGDLVIEEVMPADTAEVPEWVEIVNISGHAVSLGGVNLFKSSAEKVTFTSGTILEADGTAQGAVAVGEGDDPPSEACYGYAGRVGMQMAASSGTLDLGYDFVVDETSTFTYSGSTQDEECWARAVACDPTSAPVLLDDPSDCTPCEWGC